MFNYGTIKQLAQQAGIPVKDLVALSIGNDPFYAEVPYRLREGEWFAEIWSRFGLSQGVHLRRIHYLLVSQREEGEPTLKPNGEPYQNTNSDWALLDRASLSARYLDLVPLDALIDRRNDEPMIFAPTYSGPEVGISVIGDLLYESHLVSDTPYLPRFHIQGFDPEQDYLVEVWIEKSTQNDWLVPLCDRRGINLVVGIGELSEIRSRQLVHRVHEIGKPGRIIYISDFDPAGRSMPVAVARKVEFYISKFDIDVDVTLNPLILTEEQCGHYRLPRTPIKESEKRRTKFEEIFGAGATELDALEALYPGEMATLLTSEIDRYLDPTLRERTAEAKWEFDRQLSEIVKGITEPHQEEIDQIIGDHEDVVAEFEAWEERSQDLWSTISDELEQQKPDLFEFMKPAPRPANEPDGFVLFDSRRDYFGQIDAYRTWQRR